MVTKEYTSCVDTRLSDRRAYRDVFTHKVNCAAREGPLEEKAPWGGGCPGVQGESPSGERGCPGVPCSLRLPKSDRLLVLLKLTHCHLPGKYTGDLHPIRSCPCRAHPNNQADAKKRAVYLNVTQQTQVTWRSDGS